GRGDRGPCPNDNDHCQREENTLAQLWDLEDVGERGDHSKREVRARKTQALFPRSGVGLATYHGDRSARLFNLFPGRGADAVHFEMEFLIHFTATEDLDPLQ